jgi:phytoene dehydrogenase-like protein
VAVCPELAVSGQLSAPSRKRYAPGFRDLILARRGTSARELERHDANFVGGDIAGGISDLRQLFFRPVVKLDPYATSAPDIFLCSSFTPPGGCVHEMCGYWAAHSVLRKVFGRSQVSGCRSQAL